MHNFVSLLLQSKCYMNFKVNTIFVMLESSEVTVLKNKVGTASANSCKPQRPTVLVYDSY